MTLRAMLAAAHATGRASHARKVKGDDTDKKGYPGPPSWGFGVGLTAPHSKKKPIVTEVEQRKEPDRFNEDEHGTRFLLLFYRPKPTAGCRTIAIRRRIFCAYIFYWVHCILTISVYFSVMLQLLLVTPCSIQERWKNL